MRRETEQPRLAQPVFMTAPRYSENLICRLTKARAQPNFDKGSGAEASDRLLLVQVVRFRLPVENLPQGGNYCKDGSDAITERRDPTATVRSILANFKRDLRRSTWSRLSTIIAAPARVYNKGPNHLSPSPTTEAPRLTAMISRPPTHQGRPALQMLPTIVYFPECAVPCLVTFHGS